MELENYIYNEVDQLQIPLNYRQRNFLEKLFLKQYSAGNELAHSVMDKAIFKSQAIPYLQEALEIARENREALETVSLGEWDAVINVPNLLQRIQDRFFSKNLSYTPREKLLLLDLGDHEVPIQTKCVSLTENGLVIALEDWCRKEMMKLADKELAKNPSQPRPKTKPPSKPLVEPTEAF